VTTSVWPDLPEQSGNRSDLQDYTKYPI